MNNMTQELQVDSQEIQNMMVQAVNEAIKSLPKPKMPSWMETAVDFIVMHPWIALFILLGVATVISAVIREIICSYLKTNDILARLKRVEDKLKEVYPKAK